MAEPLPARIQADDLVIRRWVVADAEVLGRAVTENIDHLRPWMGWIANEPLSVADRRAMLSRWERDWSDGGDVALGIFKSGAVAGSTGLHRRRGPGTLEIGYWIHHGFTRRGLATKVSRLLTDTAFLIPGISTVEIHHDRANIASGGVPRKLGFTLVAERPDVKHAPGDIGVDCTWRMSRERWLGLGAQL